MKFAILAPGNIANSMAKAVSGIDGIEKYAVASRSLERAEDFAKKWGFEKAYGSYEEMLCDPEVELVYVASPHSHHYEHTKMCLEHGKAALVEKAFTMNAKQAQELIDLSREKGVFLAEAIWTRYMPSRKMITDLIDSGAIGEVTSLTANLGYILPHVERMQKPELAGGALLDLGVYPINFALMVMRGEVIDVQSNAIMSPLGVDYMNSMTLTFEGGRMAALHSTMLSLTDREGTIYGDKGYIEVQNINNCEEIRVYDKDRNLTDKIPVPEQINGYEYQVIACMKAMQEGKIECEEMPHSETLRVMKLMDGMRQSWGMKYPGE